MANFQSPDLQAIGRRVFQTRRGRLLYLVGACLVAVVVSYNSCAVYVRPNQFGVKQVTVGGGKGIKSDVYHTGLHWISPANERMFTFPADMQILSFSSDPNERAVGDKRVNPALNIQTSEGYTVTADISVVFRIEDAYKVMTGIGPGTLYEDSLVIPRSEQLLRKRLGELDAEQFYNAVERGQRIRLALTELNAELVPVGVRALQIFVRHFEYDARYQQAIEQRKIQDQTVFKNKAQAEMAAVEAEKNRIVAVGDAAVKVELARGQGEQQKLEAEADLYERKRRAAGELQVALAEAEGTRLDNEALRGVGSENMVGLKMADVLKGTRVIILPTDGENGLNPLDLKSALKRFDVKDAP